MIPFDWTTSMQLTSALGSVGSIKITFPGMHELVEVTRIVLSSVMLLANMFMTVIGLIAQSLATLGRTVVGVPSLTLSLSINETCRLW